MAYNPDAARARLPRPVIWVAVLAAVIYGGYKLWHVIHPGTPSVDPAVLAQEINATSCTSEPYELVLSGKHYRIYDCMTLDKGLICVSVVNNIPENETATAKTLFANALGGSKPKCAGG